MRFNGFWIDTVYHMNHLKNSVIVALCHVYHRESVLDDQRMFQMQCIMWPTVHQHVLDFLWVDLWLLADSNTFHPAKHTFSFSSFGSLQIGKSRMDLLPLSSPVDYNSVALFTSCHLTILFCWWRHNLIYDITNWISTRWRSQSWSWAWASSDSSQW